MLSLLQEIFPHPNNATSTLCYSLHFTFLFVCFLIFPACSVKERLVLLILFFVILLSSLLILLWGKLYISINLIQALFNYSTLVCLLSFLLPTQSWMHCHIALSFGYSPLGLFNLSYNSAHNQAYLHSFCDSDFIRLYHRML